MPCPGSIPPGACGQPGPLATLTTPSFSTCSTYVPVPAKIKVKKNKVSQGSGPCPLS